MVQSANDCARVYDVEDAWQASPALDRNECQRNRRSEAAGGRQFWAPPIPRRASVTLGGCSMICEKRTTVTMSSIETVRP